MTENFDLQLLPKKQQQLIETAQELFCAHGIRRVTVEEICEKAGVSKMTFYKYFTNKWDIAKAVLEMLFAEGINMYYQMVEEDIPFNQKVEMLLTLTKSRVHAVGVTFLNDLLQHDSPLYTYFIEKQKKTRELSIHFFKKAQEAGHIHSDINISVALFMLDRLSDLIDHPDFVKLMPDVEDRAAEIASILFHGFARAPATQQ